MSQPRLGTTWREVDQGPSDHRTLVQRAARCANNSERGTIFAAAYQFLPQSGKCGNNPDNSCSCHTSVTPQTAQCGTRPRPSLPWDNLRLSQFAVEKLRVSTGVSTDRRWIFFPPFDPNDKPGWRPVPFSRSRAPARDGNGRFVRSLLRAGPHSTCCADTPLPAWSAAPRIEPRNSRLGHSGPTGLSTAPASRQKHIATHRSTSAISTGPRRPGRPHCRGDLEAG